jgi:hypothetical protein
VGSPIATSGTRLDLAAMALDGADLPAGFRQRFFDNEGYTPGERIAAIQFGGTVSEAEIEATGVTWFYSSTFQTDDDTQMIYVYLNEFPDEDAVEAGFAFFEDESRLAYPGDDSRDEPGPVAGQVPKEITVGTFTDRADPARSERYVDATFRVDRVLAGVVVIAFGEAPAPESTLVESLAATLAERIEMVLAGQAPPDIDLTLPTRMLPLFETWPWPGNSLEGHKSATDVFGAGGPLARFGADYQSGYAAFASAGSAPGGMIHDPPYIDVAVARFASPASAMGVLEEAEALLQRHDGRPIARTEQPAPSMTGVEEVRLFSSDRPATGEPGSLHLIGSEVAFVQGPWLVVVSVQVDARDATTSPEQAEAIALDLAAQQRDCLGSETTCGPVRIPDVLTEPATPVAAGGRWKVERRGLRE